MNALFKDLHYSIRIFLKTPGFTVPAVAALALGIGATTAGFFIVNTVLLKPFWIFESGRFVMLMTTGASETRERIFDSYASPAKFQQSGGPSSGIPDVSAF